ncbi:MAG: hypothetical protein J7L72_01315 [Candidatus Aminicenantes bacterium]|nr:hypothetical protein [Candidatus Aminicenantes bacterium]
MKIISLAYFTASLGFTAWIIADSHVVTKSVCRLVLARYTHPVSFDIAYGIFYQTGLAVLIFSTAACMAYTKNDSLRKHLANLQTGILGFVLLSFAVRILTKEPEGMLPSVMCHFALVLAFSMCFMVIREKRLSPKQEQGARRKQRGISVSHFYHSTNIINPWILPPKNSDFPG